MAGAKAAVVTLIVALALALHGNARLHELLVAGNPFDAEAQAVLHKARGAVHEAWLQTNEGKQQSRRAGKGRGNEGHGQGFVGELLNSLV